MSPVSQLGVFGAGHLTEAFLEGMARVTDRPVHLYNRTPMRVEHLRRLYAHLIPVSAPEHLAAGGGLVLLIIPARAILNLDASLVARAQATGTVLVSCANGLPLDQLERAYSGLRLIRTLPNINWRVLRGVTLVQRGRHASVEDFALLREYLGPISFVHEVDGEDDFDRLGALTSCGPGLIAEVLSQFCAAFGVRNAAEQALFVETVLGTAAHMSGSKKGARALVREVANLGGLTEVGVNTLAETLPEALAAVRDRMKEKIAQRRVALTSPGDEPA